MNNLVKNVAIWLVIALVLMTVFNQFSTRQAAQKAMEYSQFIEEVKQGQIAKVTIEGRVLKGTKRSGERFDIAIIDWQNADMSAPLLAEQLRLHHSEELPIMLLAALDLHNEKLATVEPFVYEVLRKPLKFSQLGLVFSSAVASEQAIASERVADSPTPASNSQGLRVLVVDDDHLCSAHREFKYWSGVPQYQGVAYTPHSRNF